jgi:hypothetical protein
VAMLVGPKQKTQAAWSRVHFGKFSKESSYFEEENYEVIKIFGGFRKIFSFFFLK